MSKGTKACKLSKEEEEEEEYMDTNPHDDESASEAKEASIHKISSTSSTSSQQQRKLELLEEELDREVNEEFNRLKIVENNTSDHYMTAENKLGPRAAVRSKMLGANFRINWMNMRDTSTGSKLWESVRIGDELLEASELQLEEISASVPKYCTLSLFCAYIYIYICHEAILSPNSAVLYYILYILCKLLVLYVLQFIG